MKQLLNCHVCHKGFIQEKSLGEQFPLNGTEIRLPFNCFECDNCHAEFKEIRIYRQNDYITVEFVKFV